MDSESNSENPNSKRKIIETQIESFKNSFFIIKFKPSREIKKKKNLKLKTDFFNYYIYIRNKMLFKLKYFI